MGTRFDLEATGSLTGLPVPGCGPTYWEGSDVIWLTHHLFVGEPADLVWFDDMRWAPTPGAADN